MHTAPKAHKTPSHRATASPAHRAPVSPLRKAAGPLALLAAAATLAAGFTVSAPATAAGTTVAKDTFGRTVASGWGAAEAGGTWTSSSGLSVASSIGKMTMNAGQGRSATLKSVSATGADTMVTASLDKLPSSGATYLSVNGRTVGADHYRAKAKIGADGAVRLDAARETAGAEKALASVTVPGLTYKAGQKLNIKVQVTGSNPTTVAAKAWIAGTTEPSSWQAKGQDSTASLQKAGSVGLGAYTSSSATNAPITATFDNLTSATVGTSTGTTTPSTGTTTPSTGTSTAPSTGTSTGTTTAPSTGTSTTTASSRSSLVAGTYKPTSATTGVPSGTKLTPYNTSGADLVITKDGTVLDGLEIWGDIKVRAKNVTIKNSKLHGGKAHPANATGIIDANNANVTNLVVQDSTLDPQRPSYNRDGIVGHDYTSLRNHISHTNDGLGIFNRPGGPVTANVTASGNYIHTLTFFDKDAVHTDGTHNDGIQVQGGENIKIVGNTVDAFVQTGAGSTASPRAPYAGIGIMLQQNVAKLKNVVVEKNYVNGGQTGINIDHTASKQSNITVTVRENNMGRDQWDFGKGSIVPIRIISKANSTVTGLSTNRWADTKALLTVGKTSNSTTTGGIFYNS
ncbi:hypothetical protein GCM10023081_33010 [Arthrobacter ginkgonis]|uniref:Right handed beta helix domain-containing protein n=1 Tax=Arthrobacter ginkgonis TaxID=1630594 RepID=A0ABP7CM05_9MICC